MKAAEIQLVTHVLCPYVQRSIIVLDEKSIPFTRTDIDLANKPDWFKQASPMGKVPVLLNSGKPALFESAVICEYLDEISPSSLHPKDKLEKAYHRAWIEFGSALLNRIGSLYNAKDKQAFAQCTLEIHQQFAHIENEIVGGPYFSGEAFHMIDAVYGPIFRYFDVFEQFVDLQIFDDLPKTRAWRNQLRQRSSVRKAVSPEYPDLLLAFLRKRNSHMSTLIVTD